ncbi:MAG: PIN domain-containing protein [Methanoregula sp.]|nr:PIN domain-containing protein [Methanoregula sp.]
MKVYLDVCCLCRPFDDQKVNRIHRESEAIKEILVRCTRDWILVTSNAISFEISRIPDRTRMKKAQNFMDLAKEHVVITKPVSRRYQEIVALGIDPADALHLACAESAGAVLLTTDDAIINIIKRHAHQIIIEVKNPADWLMEVNGHGSKDTE